MARDVAGYLAELKALTGRNNSAFDTLIYEWLNDLAEDLETDPEKIWFLDKSVQFTLGITDVGTDGLMIDVPDNLVQFYGIWLIENSVDDNRFREVKPISERDARKRYGPLDKGKPCWYSNDSDCMRFWPPLPEDATTYTLEMSYKAALPRVALVNDTNDFMQNYHSPIIDGLRARAWEYLGQEDRAAAYWGKWNKKWADLRASNIARVLSGEVRFEPRTDADASTEDLRAQGQTDIVWGGS